MRGRTAKKSPSKGRCFIFSTTKFRITGIAPLIMHNGRMANPIDPAAKVIKSLTSRKGKTDEVYQQIAEAEFRGGLYLNDEGAPIIPRANIQAAIIAGAKKLKKGNDAKCGIFVQDDAPLSYLGPKTADDLWAKSEKFADVRSMCVQRNRIMRVRPIFHEWSAVVSIAHDTEVINDRDLEEILETAGAYVGLLDSRPTYGRFSVALIA